MAVRVPYELNPGARLLIVGEAPGETEVLKGRPFVGDSGELLDSTLLRVGLQRRQCNIANTCNYRPPGNKIAKIPADQMAEGIAELKAFIAETRPLAILTLGNTPMQALLGYTGITHRQGSLYEYDGIPLLPALHPAAVLRSAKDVVLFVHTLRRFKHLVDGKLPPRVQRTIITDPTEDDIAELERRMAASRATGADIEADDGELACCGFAPTPDWCVVIPATSPERRAHIRRLIGGGYRLIFHNSPYDIAFLAHRNGYQFKGELEDTLAQHQALHPELPRSLEALTFLYTLEPYYKNLYDDWTETKNYAEYYRYNGLDCCCTREIWESLDRQLDVKGLRNVYEGTRRVLPHAIQMSLLGMRYDSEEAKRLREVVHAEIQPLQAELDALAGRAVNVNSPPQVRKLLSNDLRIPLRVNKDSGQATTSEKTLMSAYAKLKDPKARRAVELLFAVRHRRKFISAYLKAKPSKDGRIRTSFNPAGTETGRWSASKFIITEGANLQTVPGKWKSCFPADEGQLLWFADYSQIEARFVAWLANDLDQIRLFTTGGDIHRYNASRIYNKPIDQITDHERQVAKSCVHALNYGIGPNTLADTVNKKAQDTGFWLSLDLAKKVRLVYLEQFPAVVAWQEATWRKIKKDRRLTNPFGRQRVFLGSVDAGKVAESEHTKKEGLAFVPQSTVPDMMNQAILTLREDPRRAEDGLVTAMQIHDALGGWGPEATAHVWLPLIQRAMDIPVPFESGICRVPVEIKVGKRWDQLKKVTLD